MLSLQVLLVEDDEALGHMLKARLEALSIAELTDIIVYWKRSLKEAIDFVTTAKPDVVLLDLGLPDSRGLDTFLTMKKKAPDLAIVIVSATDDRDVVVQALREGAQDYIVKGKMDPVAITAILVSSIGRQARERAEYAERKRALDKAVKALKSAKFQTTTEAKDTVVQVMEAMLHMVSREGDPES